MVRGLDVFREHFAGHADQFVLIGGTAISTRCVAGTAIADRDVRRAANLWNWIAAAAAGEEPRRATVPWRR